MDLPKEQRNKQKKYVFYIHQVMDEMHESMLLRVAEESQHSTLFYNVSHLRKNEKIPIMFLILGIIFFSKSKLRRVWTIGKVLIKITYFKNKL